MSYQEIRDPDAGTKSFTLHVPANQQRERLDCYLVQHLPDASRQRLQQAILTGAVKVNGVTVRRNYRIKPGDHLVLTVPWQPHPPLQPQNQALDILYEDEWLLALNKPAGVVVHPAFQNWEDTLLHGLLYHFQQQGIEHPPGLIHRLDKDTSGLLLVAKDPVTAALMSQQFAERHPQKFYQALVWGCPKLSQGSIKTNMGEGGHPQKRQIYPYHGLHGQPAHTDYEVLQCWSKISLVSLQIHTGRTHQIRVHMAYLGHPVIGDQLYQLPGQDASPWIARQALHAIALSFIHPNHHQLLTLAAPLPADMQHVLTQQNNLLATPCLPQKAPAAWRSWRNVPRGG